MYNLAQQQIDAVTGQSFTTALQSVVNLLTPIAKNLTPEERQQMGSIGEDNKLIVGKVLDFHTQQPGLQTPDINWATFEASWQTRSILAAVENLCHSIIEIASDTRIMHDYDLYQMMLTDYDYTKYKAGSTTAPGGFTTKYHELKQFFGNPTGKNGHNDNGNDNTASTDKE